MSQLKRYNGTSWENVGGNIAPKTTTTSSDTDTYSCNYINSLVEYSTSEVNTGKKWIDSKNIYRKVVQATTGSGTGSWTKIANLAISNLIDIHGWWITGNDKYPIDRFYNNEGITIYWNLSGIYEIHNYSYASNRSVVLIIEYTKTS